MAFEKIDPTLYTNNESIHSETSKIADKNTPWSKDGYDSRVYKESIKSNPGDYIWIPYSILNDSE